MNGRAFFDTNILIYAFEQSRSEKTEAAALLLSKATVGRSGVLSYQVIHEFFNVALRKFRPVMTAVEARRVLRHFADTFQIVTPSSDTIARAIEVHRGFHFQWFDSLILAAALEARCDVLYTEDMQHGQEIDGLTVLDPFRQ